jgi:hypothetical protein
MLTVRPAEPAPADPVGVDVGVPVGAVVVPAAFPAAPAEDVEAALPVEEPAVGVVGAAELEQALTPSASASPSAPTGRARGPAAGPGAR